MPSSALQVEFYGAVIRQKSRRLPAPMVAGQNGCEVGQERLWRIEYRDTMLRPVKGGSAEFVGTGRQLATEVNCRAIVDELEREIFQFTIPAPWLAQRPTLEQTIKTFFKTLPRNPAIVWANRFFIGETLETALCDARVVYHNSLPRLYSPPCFETRAACIRLFFEPRGWRRTKLWPSQWSWVVPSGCPTEDTVALARTTEHSVSYLADGTAPCTYREKISLVPRFNPEMSPSAFALRPVYRHPATSALILGEGMSDKNCQGCIKVGGWKVFDMNIFKLSRLIKTPGLFGTTQVIAEELVFTFERKTGRVISIATQRNPFAELASYDPERSFPARWLAAH